MPFSSFEIAVDQNELAALQTIQGWYATLEELPKPQVSSEAATTILIGDQERLGVGTDDAQYNCKKCGVARIASEWGVHPCVEGVSTAVLLLHSNGTVAYAIESLAFFKALQPQGPEQQESVYTLWLVISRHILQLCKEGRDIAPIYFHYIIFNNLLYPELSGSLDKKAVEELLGHQWAPIQGRLHQEQSMGIPVADVCSSRQIWLGARPQTIHKDLAIWSGSLKLTLDRHAVIAPFHRVTGLILMEQIRVITERRQFRCLRCRTWQPEESTTTHTCGEWSRVTFLDPVFRNALATVENVLRVMRRSRNASTFVEMWIVVTRHAIQLAAEGLLRQEELRMLVHLQLLEGFSVDVNVVKML